MMYGAASFGVLTRSTQSDFKVLSSLKTKMISSNFYEAGAEIGYGDQVLKSDGWIGVIPLGYADGILTSYTKAQVMCGKERGYIWGRTNMDMTFVYFSNKPAVDEVIIWSDNLSEFSRQVKSIPYQVLTCISQRVPKVYRF
jgi:alanine racemase